MTVFALINTLFSQPILLAARRFGRRRTNTVDTGELVIYLLISAGVITVVCLGLYAGSRLLHRRRYNSHGSLFSGLCRIHGLDRSVRRLLRQVARQNRLAHPALLFTEPRWLDPARLPGALRWQAAKVEALRSQLFTAGGQQKNNPQPGGTPS
jgi:hypothetical protein